MTPVTYAFVLAHDLHDRLRWLGLLRWIAAGGMAVVSLAGSRLGMPELWPDLLILAGLISAYNLYFIADLRRRDTHGSSHAYLRQRAILQIALDLAALLIAVQLSGGVRSPVLLFFVFHMAIGTIMLGAGTMYVVAGITSAVVLVLYVIGALGLDAPIPIAASIGRRGLDCDLRMLAFVATLFGTVYLTGTVTARSTQNALRLLEMTMELRGKTAELERALREIWDLERRKSHYMRISAHQLRSPLGTIKTSLDVLAKGYVDPSSARGRSMLEGIADRADELLAIVNDLLELAKIREGQRKAPWTRDVDVSAILEEAIGGQRARSDRRNVELVTRIENDVRVDWGVPPDLRFAFDNLLNNAIKYSHRGGEVGVSLTTSPDEMAISVTDEGIGIPDELQEDVFLEFVRAPNAKRHVSKGTGLGLPIVKETAETHGGGVDLVSREGTGTTVTVTLPLHNARPREVATVFVQPGRTAS
jgi:signal transduction histidine kinase